MYSVHSESNMHKWRINSKLTTAYRNSKKFGSIISIKFDLQLHQKGHGQGHKGSQIQLENSEYLYN